MKKLFEENLMLNSAKRVSILIAAVAVFIAGLISYINDNGGHFECLTKQGGRTVVVGHDKNTTLYGIAENNCTGDIMAAQDALYEVYGLEIFPGQMIKLPKKP